MSVTKRLRFEILRRDSHACRYCGAKAPDAELTVDHVTPKALGGTDDPTNLVAACRPCNSGKSSVPADAQTVADVDAEALEWARRVKAALAEMAVERRDKDQQIYAFGDWWATFGGPIGMDDARPYDWADSVRMFIDRGLELDDLKDLAASAMLNLKLRADGVWRYFCGMCWRLLDDAQERARRAR